MDTHKFFVEKLRFHLNEPDMLVFVGWFYDGKASGREVQAYLDGEKLPAALTVNKGAEVRQKYLGTINEINEEVVGKKSVCCFNRKTACKGKQTGILY